MNPPARYTDDPEKAPLGPDMFFVRPLAGPPAYQAVVYQPPTQVLQDRPRNTRRRRFWHFLACTFLFVTALHLLSRNNAARNLLPYLDSDEPKYDPSQCFDTVNWTEGSPSHRHDYPFHVQTSLTLPLSAAELSFIADGSLQFGDFVVSQDLDEGADDAVVFIDAFYRIPDAMDEATVCKTHLQEDEWGLGIFTPRWRHPRDSEHAIKFHVHLRLPTVPSNSILKISSLRTDLPIYTHHLPELANSVYFQNLQLQSKNAPVTVDSVAGDNIRVGATNGSIRGSFNTSTVLELRTANAPIEVFAGLMNGNERPTTLALETSNGRIESTVALASNTSSNTHGKYTVNVRTANAPLHLTFVDAPVASALTLDAHTSNSPARVVLHKTYEGAFDLLTSMFFRPEVKWSPVEDPAGRGRQRDVRFSTIGRGQVRGLVAWDEEGESRGTVKVETSNSPLQLTL
ncbi:hypothetical protein C8Q76DRAFT_791175 [Earliella scabrosa]|nr:hypothetical protein C8Q76DRAFT_791175 [Earliella scabrosa]